MKMPWVPYVNIDYVDEINPIINGVISAGRTSGVNVKIRKDWANNTGVLAHELAHVQLNYLNYLTLNFLSLFMGKKWTLWTEARAYAVQLNYPNAEGGYPSIDELADRLCSPIYSLGLTHEQAVSEIAKYRKGI